MYEVNVSSMEHLKASFALMAKLSDVINVYENTNGLELHAQNISATVSARTFLMRETPQRLKERKVTLDTHALDRIFSSMPGAFDESSIELAESQLVVNVRYQKLQRTHTIIYLEDSDLDRGQASIRSAYAFILKVPMLKSIVSHFSTSAEMLELWLETTGGVRWRGYRNPKRASKNEIYSKIDSTAAMHYTEMLQGLRVQVPWRAEFKLKEMRHTIGLLERVCASEEFCCLFDEPGKPFHICFGVGDFSYSIQFQTLNKETTSEATMLQWELTPLEFTLAPELEPESSSSSSEPPSNLADRQADCQEDSVPASNTEAMQTEDWPVLDPHAEIPSSQAERVSGLFD